MHRESCPSLVHLCLPISSASVDWIRQWSVQISIIYATLMGYWIAVQVSTMMRSGMCMSNFSLIENILGKFLMMSCALFLRAHFRSSRRIAMLGSGKVRADILGDAL